MIICLPENHSHLPTLSSFMAAYAVGALPPPIIQTLNRRLGHHGNQRQSYRRSLAPTSHPSVPKVEGGAMAGR